MNARGLFALTVSTLALACAKPAEQPRVSAGGVPLPPITAEDSTQRAGEVSRIVGEHLEAMHTGNATLLDSLTSPDVVHITPQGERLGERELLQKHSAAAPVGYEIVDIDARVFDGDMVVVNAQVREKGASALHHLTQVWVLRDDVAMAASAKAATARRPVALASLVPFKRPISVVATCCSAARWELASSHASPMAGSPNDPMQSSSPSSSPPPPTTDNE